MADTDIGRELCAKVKAVFDSRIAGDTTIAAIREKVEDGRATMNDMSVYSRQLGMRLRQAIESTVHPEDLPDETMYQNIAHSILDPLLRENYDEINRICAETQRELDRKARIGLAPQAAEYPAERVTAASFGAAAKELASDAVKVLGRTSENITASASDEYMKTNAEYRSKAGLDAYIVRTDGAGCCKWCAALAGKFKYPDEIPDDVFRRHDNCTCDVSYISAKGVQNVHTKKWTQVNEPRKIEYSKPTKRTREEAKAKESEILAQRQLTYEENRGIIQENSNRKPITEITDASIASIPLVNISGYTDEQCATIQKQHKELLEYSRENNNNREVAFVLDNSLSSRKEYMGSDDIIDFGGTLNGKDLILLHNHPRNSSYSFNDIVEFFGNESIKTLTIVKNNGKVETLTKINSYNRLDVLKSLNRINNDIKKKAPEKGEFRDSLYRKEIKKILNKHQLGGLIEWTQ